MIPQRGKTERESFPLFYFPLSAIINKRLIQKRAVYEQKQKITRIFTGCIVRV